MNTKRSLEIAQFIFPFVVIGFVWEITVRLGIGNSQTLPPPSAIIQSALSLILEKGVLHRHLAHSLYRLALGYILAVGVGIAVGTGLALQRTAGAMFSPVLSLLISIPTIAWVPVLLITMGLGDRTVITAVFLGGVFEMTYSTIAGIRTVSRQQVNAARSMGVGSVGLLFRVLLPGSLVSVIPALRLSVGYCWRALVGGEMLSAMVRWGIGRMIYDARFWNDVKAMFVGLLVIAFLGVLLDRAVLKRLEGATIERWGMVVER